MNETTAPSVHAEAARLPQDLAGCRVVLTAQRRADEFAAALERRGATVVHAPTLSHIPHVDDPELIARTGELIDNPPDVVIVTTGVGFRGWMEAADAAGQSDALLAVLENARLIARGPKARGALQREGLTVDWTAESETAQEIKERLQDEGVAGLRVAVQHHGAGSDGLDEMLRRGGADVAPLIVYRWGPAPDPVAVEAAVDIVARRDADCIAFTSAPGAHAFLEAAERAGVRDLVLDAMRDGDVLAAAVGDTTAAPLREHDIDPLVPERFRMGALVRAIVFALKARRSPAGVTSAGLLELTRDQALLDGDVLPLAPSSLAVLRKLMAAEGSVVPREELLTVLPGAGDAHSVEVAVARLREALASKESVVTVIKRGYRLEVLDA